MTEESLKNIEERLYDTFSVQLFRLAPQYFDEYETKLYGFQLLIAINIDKH